MKNLLLLFVIMGCFPAVADDMKDAVSQAEQVFETAHITCSGIADEIGQIANISKANTAVTAVGTVAAGGALIAGIKKSQEEQEIEKLINEMCTNGGCTSDTVNTMTDEQFLITVLQPMAQITELQRKINKSKKLGNWRTGLMAGTIGTNLTSAIISGLNKNQSDLIQHISACNKTLDTIPNIETKLKQVGADPIKTPIFKQLGDVKKYCNQIDVHDIEKIENRMKGVMGTSIAGTAVSVIGVGTSAVANSDKYTDTKNKIEQNAQDKKKEHSLNTTANIMAGANMATSAVETGLNISLITLTKKLIAQAKSCEEVFQ